MPTFEFNPLIGGGVFLSTGVTEAVYVLFYAAVAARKWVAAASWSSLWYMLSAFAVISYTHSWIYVAFAATGSWVGAYVTMTWLKSRPAPEDRGPHPERAPGG